jgi:hypothetical protein
MGNPAPLAGSALCPPHVTALGANNGLIGRRHNTGCTLHAQEKRLAVLLPQRLTHIPGMQKLLGHPSWITTEPCTQAGI